MARYVKTRTDRNSSSMDTLRSLQIQARTSVTAKKKQETPKLGKCGRYDVTYHSLQYM